MARNDVMELVGLGLMVTGAGVLFYALYRLDVELALTYLAFVVIVVGAFIVSQANRGSE